MQFQLPWSFTVTLWVLVISAIYVPTGSEAKYGSDLHSPYTLTDALLREVVEKMGQATDDYLKYPAGR